MLFKRPVSEEFPVSAPYGKWGAMWSKHIGALGVWENGQINGQGQHKGIDFAVPEGTPVHAAQDGVVVRAGWENASDPKQGFGLRVRQEIVTEGGVSMTLVYGHLSVISVQEGHQVAKGDRIGFSGKTGHATGPHLHVELIDRRGQYHPIDFEPSQPPPTIAA